MVAIPYYHVDAFTGPGCRGNPAAVCPLPHWPDDRRLQRMAAEHNLSETAFLVARDDDYDLRWFTPAVEVDLCGHATLAAAHVVLRHLRRDAASARFHTRSGVLAVTVDGDALVMDFPARPAVPAPAPAGLAAGLGVAPRAVLKSRDYLCVLDDEDGVRTLRPDFARLAFSDALGVIVTAPGRDVDFVSRFFAPAAGIPEDPVTGSAHCTLVPYWAGRLGRTRLRARQVSPRGGELQCELRGDRVWIGGRATTYLEGTAFPERWEES